MAALGAGAGALAEARTRAPEGAAREAAALECLRLLRTAFALDVQLVQRLRAAEAGELTAWSRFLENQKIGTSGQKMRIR